MTIERLTAIARERYETGAHAGTHLVIAPSVRPALFARHPESNPAPWDPSGAFARLVAIPVVVDEAVPPGGWRLVRDDDRSVVESGRLVWFGLVDGRAAAARLFASPGVHLRVGSGALYWRPAPEDGS